jgi:hypothetical protein
MEGWIKKMFTMFLFCIFSYVSYVVYSIVVKFQTDTIHGP